MGFLCLYPLKVDMKLNQGVDGICLGVTTAKCRVDCALVTSLFWLIAFNFNSTVGESTCVGKIFTWRAVLLLVDTRLFGLCFMDKRW